MNHLHSLGLPRRYPHNPACVCLGCSSYRRLRSGWAMVALALLLTLAVGWWLFC